MSDETLYPPPSPSELLQRVPLGPESVRILPAGTLLCRVYSRGGAYPYTWNEFRAFGPTSSRFDHHLPSPKGTPHVQARKICYAAPQWMTCIAEVVQESGVLDPTTNEPWLAMFRLAREVRLLDVTGMWSNWARVGMDINYGNRARTREWSKVIYDAYPEVEGIWYLSRWHPEHVSAALFERAENAFAPAPEVHRALADPKFSTELLRAVRTFRYAIVNYP